MSDVDSYLAKVAAPERAELERIRKIIKTVVPEVDEVISYGMPGFKYKGKYLIGYNSLKDHMSLFPTSEPIEKLKSKLTEYSLSKGTIRFTLEKPIPEALIIEIVQVRVEAIAKA